MPHFTGSLIGLLLLLIFTACISLDPDRQHSPNYKDGRYQNIANDDKIANRSFFDVLKWKILGPKHTPAVFGIDTPPPDTKEIITSDLMAQPGEVRIVWLGHASVWIASNQNGRRFHVVTDPVFNSIPMRERLTAMPIQANKMPRIDMVLISHAHRDHLDMDTLRAIQKRSPNVRFLLPSGLKLYAKDYGLINVRTMEWWQFETRGSNRIRFTPAHHWSRMGLNDKMQSHWGSYVIEMDGRRIFFAGDTGYSEHFGRIADKYIQGFDVTLMPIGAFEPRWFMRPVHIGPIEALQASSEMGSRLMLPIHWGTFALGDDKPGESAAYLAKLLPHSRQHTIIWKPGQIIKLK